MNFDLTVEDNGDITIRKEGYLILTADRITPVFRMFGRYIKEERLRISGPKQGRGRPTLITTKMVKSIREDYLKDSTCAVLARKYRLSESSIYAVITGRHSAAKELPNISRPRRKKSNV